MIHHWSHNYYNTPQVTNLATNQRITHITHIKALKLHFIVMLHWIFFRKSNTLKLNRILVVVKCRRTVTWNTDRAPVQFIAVPTGDWAKWTCGPLWMQSRASMEFRLIRILDLTLHWLFNFKKSIIIQHQSITISFSLYYKPNHFYLDHIKALFALVFEGCTMWRVFN